MPRREGRRQGFCGHVHGRGCAPGRGARIARVVPGVDFRQPGTEIRSLAPGAYPGRFAVRAELRIAVRRQFCVIVRGLRRATAGSGGHGERDSTIFSLPSSFQRHVFLARAIVHPVWHCSIQCRAPCTHRKARGARPYARASTTPWQGEGSSMQSTSVIASKVCFGQSPQRCVLRLARRIVTTRVASKDASQSTAPLQLPKDRSVRFGFSAGGLLFPFYVGVCRGLEEAGYLSANTKLAGAWCRLPVVDCAGRPSHCHSLTLSLIVRAFVRCVGGIAHRRVRQQRIVDGHGVESMRRSDGGLPATWHAWEARHPLGGVSPVGPPRGCACSMYGKDVCGRELRGEFAGQGARNVGQLGQLWHADGPARERFLRP